MPENIAGTFGLFQWLEPTYVADYPGLTLPHSEHCSSRAIMLPIYPQMSEAQQAFVIESLLEVTS